MTLLRDILGNDWDIVSAGGQTGEAYIARSGTQKLFLKRNSSPFLAVLSAEGIVPRLLWTKRLENGDVITAQHWLQSRELRPNEMKNEAVVALLRKIHRSEALLTMMKRLGKKALTPDLILEKIAERKNMLPGGDEILEETLSFLNTAVRDIQFAPRVVCHCDVNHNNWLLTDEGHLYLVDWDNAMVADPALDIGMLLYRYIARKDWHEWCERYGLELNENLRKRMHWYTTAQTVLFMFWHRERGEVEKEKQMHEYLRQLNRTIPAGLL